MLMVVFSLIPILMIFVFFMLIPIIIGVFVYRDASERGMNALLWTIIAVFVPSLLGLIIYLIFRENYSALACANCGERVNPDFVNCPSCGSELREKCPSCGIAVEPHYKVCPNCAANLDYNLHDPYKQRTVKKGNKSLIVILAVVVLLPFIIVVVLGSLFYTVKSTSIYEENPIPFEEFFDDEESFEDPFSWGDIHVTLLPVDEI